MRTAVMAAAAVGLSVGSFRLGTQSAGVAATPSIPPAVAAPADHPLSVVSQPTVINQIPLAQRVKLAKIAEEYKTSRSEAAQQATKEAANVAQFLKAELVSHTSPPPSKPARTSKDAKVQQTVPGVDLGVIMPPGQLVDRTIDQVTTELTAQRERMLINEVDRQFSARVLDATPVEIRSQIELATSSRKAMDEERGFGLLIALRNRDELGLSPAQVTKLQLLQADFIVHFAPIREAYETRPAIIDLRVVPSAGNVIELSYPTISFQVDSTGTPVNGGANVKSIQWSSRQQIDAKIEASVTSSNAPAKRVPVDRAAEVRFAPAEKKPGQGNLWTSDAELASRLAKLKARIDAKAEAILKDDQKKQLKRLVDQSLAIGK